MPRFFRFPWADSGDKTVVPDTTQLDGSVSYQQGFGDDYEKDLDTDPNAKAVPRPETNDLYFELTDNLRQWQTLGVYDFITPGQNGGVAFSYPKFARCRYNGSIYENLEASNTNAPDAPFPSGWALIEESVDDTQSGVLQLKHIWNINTSSGSSSRQTPASPSDGQIFRIKDKTGFCFANPATIEYDGANTIQGLAEDMIINEAFMSLTLKYDAANTDWRIISE